MRKALLVKCEAFLHPDVHYVASHSSATQMCSGMHSFLLICQTPNFHHFYWDLYTKESYIQYSVRNIYLVLVLTQKVPNKGVTRL